MGRTQLTKVAWLAWLAGSSCAAPAPAPYAPPPERNGRSTPEHALEDVVEARALPPDPSLDDLRLYAALYNPGLQARFHEFQGQAQRATRARALPEPRFTYTEYFEEIETRTGPQERAYALSQSFPWFGTLKLRGEIEDRGTEVAYQRFLAAHLVLDRAVRTTYADYYFLARSVAITQENLELLRRLEGVARQKLAAGTRNHADVVRLQVEMGRLEDQLKTLTDLRAPLQAKLNALLNRPADSEIPWPSSLSTSVVPVDASTLDDVLRENNPELVALHHEIEQADLGQELARKEYFPDFAVGVKTIETGSAIAPGTRGSGDDPWLLTFSVELPIWTSKYRAGQIEAQERWHATRKRREDATNQLVAEVQQALYEQRDAERRLKLYNDTLIPKALESLTATEAAYEAGTSDFLELIDAERALLEFQLAGERGRADLLRAVAEIDRLLGRFVIGPTRLRKGASP